VNRTGEVFGSFQLGFDERLINDHLCGDIGQFASLPDFYLSPHRLEIPLHAVDAHRNAVDERERFRVLGEDWCKVTSKRHV
jgi:hypothetical protein